MYSTKKQDKEAANTLISYYYKEIYAYVYRQTGNEELAKDLTQDIFIPVSYTHLRQEMEQQR